MDAIINKVNSTDDEIGYKDNIHIVLHQMALNYAEHIALVNGSISITYKQLDDFSNAVCNMLINDIHVDRNKPVAILVGNSIEKFCYVIGILKAGLTYVPIDGKTAVGRIGAILKLADCSIILTEKSQQATIDALIYGEYIKSEIVVMKTWMELIELDCSYHEINVGLERVAYIIFTSGSTGIPKGVEVQDKALLNLCWAMKKLCGITEHDRTCILQNFSFDFSVMEMYSFMLSGAMLYLVPDNLKEDIELLNEYMIRNGITMQTMTTALYNLFVDLDNPVLKKLFIGGEKMTKFIQKSYDIYNMYGPTETTVIATFMKIEQEYDNIPIGFPICNTKILIINEEGRILNIGETGEICIQGMCIAKGYLNNPEETDKRFVPSVLNINERMYCTGDLGRWTENGLLEFFGRSDFQIKHRGYRIELDAINKYILKLQCIDNSVVIYNDKTENKYIACFYCSHQDITEADLRNQLKEAIPDYMMPGRFIHVDSIPLNNNGKIDRNKLMKMLPSQKIQGETISDESVKGKLKAIWADLLCVEVDSIKDNVRFNSIGGYSLLALLMLRKINEVFDVKISFADFLEKATIQSLFDIITSSTQYQETSNNSNTIEFSADIDNKYEPFELNDLQQAYLVGRNATIELGTLPSHLYLEIECPNYSNERFIKAAKVLMLRHDALCLRICDDGTQYVLKPELSKLDDIDVFDLSKVPEPQKEETIGKIRTELSSIKIDYTRESLVQLRIIKYNTSDAIIMVYFDGFLADGWSQELLLHELDILYDDDKAKLPNSDVTFRDYVIYKKKLKESDQYRESRNFWLKRIEAMPSAAELPLVKQPSFITSPNVKFFKEKISQDDWSNFEINASKNGVSTFIAMLTAFGKALARWSRKQNFIISIPECSRFSNNVNIDNLFGECASFLLFEIADKIGESFVDMARKNQSQLAELTKYNLFSGIDVLREMSKENGYIGNAAPIVFTSLLDSPIKEENNFHLKHFQTHTSQVWIDVVALRCNDEICFSWDYVSDVFDEYVLKSMADSFMDELKQLADSQEVWNTLSELPLVKDDVERVKNADGPVVNWNYQTITELLMQSEVENANQIALCTSNRSYTYAETFRMARALANQLQKMGVKKNDKVAILMNKRMEQIVSVLATIYCGAVYVPMDIYMNMERFNFCMEETNAKIVIYESSVEKKFGLSRAGMKYSLFNVDENPLEALTGTMNPISTEINDLFCIIYTSGSTGKPKGVMLEQKGMINCLLFTNDKFSITKNDKVITLTNLSHDMSIYDIFGMLIKGAAVVIPDGVRVKDPAHWIDMIEKYQVTIWNTVPTMMEMMINTMDFIGKGNISSLRLVIMGGDVLCVTLPTKLRKASKDVLIVNVGGPTETTIWSIYHIVTEDDEKLDRIPYGTAISNTKYMVLNDNLQLCPYDVVGTLYSEGVNISSGYLNDVEMTNAKFIVNPYSDNIMYNTGDVGKYRKDGSIDILGRSDFQVKINGKRIELGEIEQVAASNPAVNKAVAVIEENNGKYINLYYEANSDMLVDDLREYLEQYLPDYMIPRNYMRLDNIPLSTNGKINRKQLPAFDIDYVKEEVTVLTDTVSVLIELYKEVIGVNNVNISDNFFRIGGDSLKAIKLLQLIQERLNVEVSLTNIFNCISVSSLAEFLDNEKAELQH